jgi:putative DNA primase/helicase
VEAISPLVSVAVPSVPVAEIESEISKLPLSTSAVRWLSAFIGQQPNWITPAGKLFVTLPDGLHVPADSQQFDDYVGHASLNTHGTIPRDFALQSAKASVRADARSQNRIEPVYVRLARLGETIYFDLANSKGDVVAINAMGWEVIQNPPVKFYRPLTLKPLPLPTVGGSVGALRPLINIERDEQFHLVLGWLLGTFLQTGTFPVFVISGEQGSGKTDLARILKRLVDLDSVDLRSPPTNVADLRAAANNSRLLAFDNVSRISPTIADALCRVASGISMGGRKLYTDSDEANVVIHAPVLLNGIPTLVGRPDLADRAIVLELPRIRPELRVEERVLWENFEAAHPYILGGMCDAVSGALRHYSKVELPVKPRLADWAVWVTAGEASLGLEEGSILNAFNRNQEVAIEELLETDVTAQVLMMALRGRGGRLNLSPTELFTVLSTQAPSLGEMGKASFPRSAKALAEDLKRLAPALSKSGVTIDRRRTGKERLYTITAASTGHEKDTTADELNEGLPIQQAA